eukprot:symbB.v1.2.000898.t1/scaffold27.1/size414596/6
MTDPEVPATGAEVKKKKINLLGFQVQVAEQKVKNVLLGATTFFVGFNALALPFAVPKLRRLLYLKLHPQLVLFQKVCFILMFAQLKTQPAPLECASPNTQAPSRGTSVSNGHGTPLRFGAVGGSLGQCGGWTPTELCQVLEVFRATTTDWKGPMSSIAMRRPSAFGIFT